MSSISVENGMITFELAPDIHRHIQDTPPEERAGVINYIVALLKQAGEPTVRSSLRIPHPPHISSARR